MSGNHSATYLARPLCNGDERILRQMTRLQREINEASNPENDLTSLCRLGPPYNQTSRQASSGHGSYQSTVAQLINEGNLGDARHTRNALLFISLVTSQNKKLTGGPLAEAAAT